MAWRFALLLICVARSWACSCSGNWPSVKQAWKAAPAVFLGTVALADPDGDANQLMFQNQLVHIRVDEAFKGVFAGQTIELHEGASDCDGKFRTGERAVFYLHTGTQDRWSLPWCTYAVGSAEPAGDDLLFLKALPKSAVGTRLSGTVEWYEDAPDQAFKRIGGVPNVRVTISGPQSFRRQVVTNANGVYEAYGLPPGSYSVSIAVPSGLKIKFPFVTGSPPVKGNDAGVELARDGGASVGFVLQADTQVSGRILDAKGRSIAGTCVDLEPLEGRSQNGGRFFDCSKHDGGFNMTMMPAGKYRLVVRDEVRMGSFKSKSTLYYPGVRDREHATIITIEAARYLEGLDIRLPSAEKRYAVQGRFQFADGVAVAHAGVTFTSARSGYAETTETDADGAFGLSVLAGMEGELTGVLGVLAPILSSCPEFKVNERRAGMFRFMDARPVSLSMNSDHEDVRLELDSPSCKAWK